MSERKAVHLGLLYLFAVLAASLFFPVLAPILGLALPVAAVVVRMCLRRSAGG
ncbi:hypothetical protein [Crossiella sp. CA198]|uniref:hypothetical protein n=1 Tax=Crossiella sp. CA198 TaxID=3455607 RepID=UPI003F8D2C47